MTTVFKLRRGTTSQHSTFTGANGEVTVDTSKKTVVVHDGSTAGGIPLAKESSVISAVASLGYTPYNATNPNGYTSNTGTVTAVSGSAPIVSSGGTAPAISIPAANSTTNGYMSSTHAAKLDGITAGAAVAAVNTGAGISSTGGTTPTISLGASGVTAGTQGSSSSIPVVTVDTYGRVTSLSSAAITSSPVLQVVTSTGLSGSSTTSTSYVSSGISATITPRSSSSKVQITFEGVLGVIGSAPMFGRFAVFRTSVAGTMVYETSIYINGSFTFKIPDIILGIDTPATTSPVTYVVGIAASSTTQTIIDAGGLITLTEIA